MEARAIHFDGFDAIEIVTAEAKLIVVTGMGPRIAFWGQPDGENLLYWENNDLGREEWRLLGGHRVWVTRPGADEAEDAYAADNAPCEVEIKDDGVRVIGGIHPLLKIQRGLDIHQLTEDSFQVTSFLKNEGPMLYSGGVWAPTCIDPTGGKEFGIVLGDRDLTWDLVKIVIPRSFAGHSARVNDPQISYNEDFMIIRPEGVESKRMVMAPHGVVAMTWPGKSLSFVKKSIFNPQGQYPMGCNLAVYIGPDNFMVEMESYGAEQTVLPGQTISNYEVWKLLDYELQWQDPRHFVDLFV